VLVLVEISTSRRYFDCARSRKACLDCFTFSSLRRLGFDFSGIYTGQHYIDLILEVAMPPWVVDMRNAPTGSSECVRESTVHISNQTAFLATKKCAALTLEERSIGTEIAIFRLVGNAAPMLRTLIWSAYGYHLTRFHRSTQRSGRQTPAWAIPHYGLSRVVRGTDTTHIP